MRRRYALALCAGLLLPALFVIGDDPPPGESDVKAAEVAPQLVTAWCYRAVSKTWYAPGEVWVWTCSRAPDTDQDGCYEWESAQNCLVWDGEYTFASSCGECECSSPCFNDPNAAHAAAAAEAGPARGPIDPGFRLDRPLPADADFAAFGFPREANPQMIAWPDEPPSFVVRVERDAETYWDLKLFPTTVVVNPQGPGGDPAKSKLETLRLGFQIEPLAGDERPMFTTTLGALRPARDPRHDIAFDGLYELRLGKETFYVRMKDDPR